MVFSGSSWTCLRNAFCFSYTLEVGSVFNGIPPELGLCEVKLR